MDSLIILRSTSIFYIKKGAKTPLLSFAASIRDMVDTDGTPFGNGIYFRSSSKCLLPHRTIRRSFVFPDNGPIIMQTNISSSTCGFERLHLGSGISRSHSISGRVRKTALFHLQFQSQLPQKFFLLFRHFRNEIFTRNPDDKYR